MWKKNAFNLFARPQGEMQYVLLKIPNVNLNAFVYETLLMNVFN